MKKSVWSLSPILIVSIILMTAQTVICAFTRPILFILSAVITVFAIIFTLLRMHLLQNDIRRYVARLSETLEAAGSQVLTGFSMPVVVASEKGEIVWYNEAFRNSIISGDDIFGENISTIINESVMTLLNENKSADFEYDGQLFTVYLSHSEIEKTAQQVFYFVNETKLKRTAEEYGKSRPVVAYITIDSLDEFLKNVRDSERAAAMAAVEQLLEEYAASGKGLVCKLSGNLYLYLTEERYLKEHITNKFDLLDKARGLLIGEKTGVTLSVGVGRGGRDLRECDDFARQALDMALGRGGDQVAVKDKNTYEFFGGVSGGVEKRTKVRSRIISAAIRRLIEESDNVLIMGHSFSDLDSFGAAWGIYKISKVLNTDAKIIVNRDKTLAEPLIDKFMCQNGQGDIISDKAALPLITRKTLLIIVDTHRADFLESKEVYNACKTLVVIDHHRKTVDFIDNSVIFYHEPTASSASEMVAEMVQYMGDKFIGKTESEALLSGIMLDTRNFVLRTGVRTFEASAYLRSRGADPVEVKRLFAGSMESYNERAAIVSAAEIYNECAIAYTPLHHPEIRVAAAQAADELLSISGVKASFVIFYIDGIVNISARSMGSINVQIIMEALGGGGHHTMAAAQLKDETIENARQRLMNAISDLTS